MDTEDWMRLGERLISRRVELGYANRERWFAHLGIESQTGPRRTIEDIEAGRRSNYKASTLAQIEFWYRWTGGSIAAVLAGRDSTPFPEAGKSVGPPDDDAGVLLKLSPEAAAAYARMDPLTRERALSDATSALLRVAEEARRRADDH